MSLILQQLHPNFDAQNNNFKPNETIDHLKMLERMSTVGFLLPKNMSVFRLARSNGNIGLMFDAYHNSQCYFESPSHLLYYTTPIIGHQ